MTKPLSEAAREALLGVSTATLTTQLFKRGLRNTFVQGARPLNPNAPAMVGPAYTLRYIPAREAAGKLGARVRFDRRGQPSDHIVKQRDVVRGINIGARDEQVGDVPQRCVALLLGLGGERILDFVDQAR